MGEEHGTGRLLDYEKRLRLASSRDEYSHRLIAGLSDLVGFQTAALVGARGVGQRVTHVSDTSQVDQTAPLINLFRRVAAEVRFNEAIVGEYAHTDFSEELRADFDALAPTFVVLVRLTEAAKEPGEGLLILLRARPLKKAQMELLDYLSGLWTHGLRALARGRRRRPAWPWMRLVTLAVFVLLAVTPLVPMRLSVTAPAEVTASAPVVITAPLNGVVEDIPVGSRQSVQAGDVLIHFDDRDLQNAFEIALQEAIVAESELRAAEQASFRRPAERARIAELQTQADLARMQADQARARLERATVRAPVAGEVLIDRPSQWAGRPVQVGEKILELADSGRTELVIRVSVGDAIRYELGDLVRFYVPNAPFEPIAARLTEMDFAPSMSPSGLLTFRLKAEFIETTSTLRLGAQGTAKVYGPESNLFLYLFRRPLAWLSRTLAL